MKVELTYQNLEFPKMYFRRQIEYKSIAELGQHVDTMRNDILVFEAYQKGLRDSNNPKAWTTGNIGDDIEK